MVELFLFGFDMLLVKIFDFRNLFLGIGFIINRFLVE